MFVFIHSFASHFCSFLFILLHLISSSFAVIISHLIPGFSPILSSHPVFLFAPFHLIPVHFHPPFYNSFMYVFYPPPRISSMLIFTLFLFLFSLYSSYSRCLFGQSLASHPFSFSPASRHLIPVCLHHSLSSHSCLILLYLCLAMSSLFVVIRPLTSQSTHFLSSQYCCYFIHFLSPYHQGRNNVCFCQLLVD